MRPVIYTDKDGWKRRALVRDSDGDELAPQGVPANPPDLNMLDWNEIAREINNILVDQGIFTYEDVNRNPVGFSAFNTIIKRHLIAALKQESAGAKK